MVRLKRLFDDILIVGLWFIFACIVLLLLNGAFPILFTILAFVGMICVFIVFIACSLILYGNG